MNSRSGPASRPTDTSSFRSPCPMAPAPNGIDEQEQEPRDGDRDDEGDGQVRERDQRVEAREATTNAIGIAGSVSSLGSSRWSRSVASSSTSATRCTPRRSRPAPGPGTAAGAAPSAERADDDHDRRAPVDRAGRCRPRARASGPRSGRRRSPRSPPTTARIRASGVEHEPESTARVCAARRAAVARAQVADAPASASSTSVAWVTPVAPRGRVRVRLAEVARAADVEVGPRHRPELLEEQAALHERAVRRAGVLEVGVPALHLGHVVLDQRDPPVALAGPVARPRTRSSQNGSGVANAPVTRLPIARPTAPVSVATSTMWVAPSCSA